MMPLLQRKRYLNLNHAGIYAPAPGGGGDSAAYTNFIARTSGLDGTHTSAYQALLNGLTTDGFFDGSGNSAYFDALYIFATQDATTARLNLVSSSFGITEVNTPIFTADTGYGATGGAWLTTGFNPTTASSPKYTQNSAHMSAWNTVNAQDTGALGGNDNSAFSNAFFARYTDDKAYTRINESGSGSAGYTVADARGHLIGNRSGASAHQAYKNGASLGSGTDGSTAPVNAAITFMSVAGSIATNSHSLAAASIGKSLTSGEATSFYNRLRTYMTAVGIP